MPNKHAQQRRRRPFLILLSFALLLFAAISMVQAYGRHPALCRFLFQRQRAPGHDRHHPHRRTRPRLRHQFLQNHHPLARPRARYTFWVTVDGGNLIGEGPPGQTGNRGSGLVTVYDFNTYMPVAAK